MTRYLAIFALASLTACSGGDVTRPDDLASPPPGLKDRQPGVPIGHHLHANKDALGRRTVRNAAKLERAMWRFAGDNGGMIPVSMGDMNAAGKTLVDYLPGRRFLKNAYTRQRTEPSYGFAGYEGQVCFAEIRDRDGYVIGFTISAYGAYPEVYLEYDRYLSGRNPNTLSRS